MLTILVGMSGSGKDAIQKELVNPDNGYEMERVVTATTRPMRVGEQDGVDYHFMSREEFQRGIEQDNFIEYRSYDTLVNGQPDTWYYGSPKAELDPSKDYVIILDVQGAKDFVNHYGKENCFVVMVEVDDQIREARAMKRGSFDKTEWDRRAADDELKFCLLETEPVVNFRVINNEENNLDGVVGDILEAMDVYDHHEKETGTQYIVEAQWRNNGYYEPPEYTFEIHSAEELQDRTAAYYQEERYIAKGLQFRHAQIAEEELHGNLSFTLNKNGYSLEAVSYSEDNRLFMVAVSEADGTNYNYAIGLENDNIVVHFVDEDLPFLSQKTMDDIEHCLQTGAEVWKEQHSKTIEELFIAATEAALQKEIDNNLPDGYFVSRINIGSCYREEAEGKDSITLTVATEDVTAPVRVACIEIISQELNATVVDSLRTTPAKAAEEMEATLCASILNGVEDYQNNHTDSLLSFGAIKDIKDRKEKEFEDFADLF